MKAIVLVDNHWGIGRGNNLLIKIPEDMKKFRHFTLNNAVIMGRKTMESMGCKPLKDRLNIVLTRNYDIYYSGFIFVHSEKELIYYLSEHNLFDKSWVIGGSEIYSLLLKYCMEIRVTKVDADLHADTYIDNLDADSSTWIQNAVIDEPIMYENYRISFLAYTNMNAFIQFMETVVFKRKLHNFEKLFFEAGIRNFKPIADQSKIYGDIKSTIDTINNIDIETRSTSTCYDHQFTPQTFSQIPHNSNTRMIAKGDNIDDTKL